MKQTTTIAKRPAAPAAAPVAPLKTPEQVRAEFERKGISIAAWARQHKISPQLAYEILNHSPRRRCSRGASHRAAVLLGLKHGEIAHDVTDMNVVLVAP